MSSKSHRYGMVVALAIAALAATAPAAPAETDQQLRDDVTAREQRSDLIGAHVVQRRIEEPTEADRTHTLSLMRTLQALNTADSLRESGDGAAAARLLDAQITKLDPVEDRFLIVAVSRASRRAAQAGRADADAEAIGALTKADSLAEREHWAKAAMVYKSVAAQAADTIDPSLRRRAVVGQLTAEREVAEREPSTAVARVNDTLLDALRWFVTAAIPLALLLVLVSLGRLSRRLPRRGTTSVALTEVGGTGQDHLLSQELADAILSAQRGTLRTGPVDLRDIDGTAVPLLRVDTFAVPAQPADVDGQVTIGPVGFNLAQALRALKRMFTRPCETQLTGTVQADGTVVRIALKGRRRGELLGPWSATGATREQAIRAVAQQYVVHLVQDRATTDWASYRAYCDAVERLDPNAGKDALVAAQAALERALAHDAFNLPARLRLGTVLRLLGDNAGSAHQLELLLEDIADADRLPPLARALVERHPEVAYVARYERYIALAKLEDRQREARAGLGELVKELRARKAEPALRRLFPLALAAWGAAHLSIGKDELSRRAILRRLDQIAEELHGL